VQEELLIREATLAERPAIADLTRDSYSEYASSRPDKSWLDYEERTRKTILEDNNILRLTALLKDRIVGSVVLCPPYEMRRGNVLVKNIYPEMRLLAVSKDFRNLGIGAKLIDECEKIALSKGFKTITLHTTILMQTAKLMYERRGYSRYQEIDFQPTPGFIVWGYKKQFN